MEIGLDLTERSTKLQTISNIDWVRKLTSRKFWLAIANFVTMLIVAFGGTDNQATQVASIIMAGATVIAYIIGEGLTDASSMANSNALPLIEIEDGKGED